MSMSLVGSKGTGFNRLMAKVKRRFREEPAARLDRFGRAVVEYARARAPVDTGQLRESIGYTFDASTLTVHVHADVPYAIFVEYGTSRNVAQPFIRPAVEEARPLLHITDTVQAQFPNVPGRYAAGMAAKAGLGIRHRG